MTKRIALALILILICASSIDAQPAVKHTVGCGGFLLPYGTSFGAAGPSRARLRASSVTAVAAVVPPESSDLHPRAWMVWDERGMPWLALTKKSPNDLKKLWSFPTPLEFGGGGPFQVRFTPLKAPLPDTYALAACPYAQN